ncbi:hypothetical protein FANTH_3264 [Fusarium anthophilum]|uniref:Uncharacterized protein n=1 Tax=Fusarium anthophilum TaxID=48485 RepID=A0A8H4ZRY9_9HYPO|nr:hypothetical protein FANTH_3264 [Fusarium anthophilum]
MPTPSSLLWVENPRLLLAFFLVVIAAILVWSVHPNAPGDLYRWVTIERLVKATAKGVKILTKVNELLTELQ